MHDGDFMSMILANGSVYDETLVQATLMELRQLIKMLNTERTALSQNNTQSFFQNTPTPEHEIQRAETINTLFYGLIWNQDAFNASLLLAEIGNSYPHLADTQRVHDVLRSLKLHYAGLLLTQILINNDLSVRKIPGDEKPNFDALFNGKTGDATAVYHVIYP